MDLFSRAQQNTLEPAETLAVGIGAHGAMCDIATTPFHVSVQK